MNQVWDAERNSANRRTLCILGIQIGAYADPDSWSGRVEPYAPDIVVPFKNDQVHLPFLLSSSLYCSMIARGSGVNTGHSRGGVETISRTDT